MATLLLTTVGTLVGGPIGGAIGAFAGQQIDAAVFGRGSIQGPRLKDLAVTTSSYGQPIPRHFGTMRVAGQVIWATELKETKEKSGGGKGKPKTTTYSYSASFAVALSSRPIDNVGRIWADGDLLRGAAGDLKVGGSFRMHRGLADQAPDHLLASAQGDACPGFRDCAYVVFEDLELGDFGNRIPALTFEVFADAGGTVSLGAVQNSRSTPSLYRLPGLIGFSDEGGEIGASLKIIDQLFPLLCVDGDGIPDCSPLDANNVTAVKLPAPLDWENQDQPSARETFRKTRAAQSRPQPRALRYYDRDRDFQPGVQRSIGLPASGQEIMVQFPGTFAANDARELCENLSRKERWRGETVTWRVAELDPTIGPGMIVSLPDTPGHWFIKNWEWLDRGVELQLERISAKLSPGIAGDSGDTSPPADTTASATILHAFELPWDGSGSSDSYTVFAAASSETEGWRGAYLYAQQGTGLVGIGPARPARCTIGTLTEAALPSSSRFFEPTAGLHVELVGSGLEFSDTSIEGLVAGTNRLLVGNEVVQFLTATPLANNRWELRGLLRGRGGTEVAARQEHAAGTSVMLLDDDLTVIDAAEVASDPSSVIAAIGLGDDAPVQASLENAGLTRRPLSPVHARRTATTGGDQRYCWTRRARGQWRWEDYVDVAQIEERSQFLVSFGPISAPFQTWTIDALEFVLSASAKSFLIGEFGAADLSVRQLGTYGQSEPLHLDSLQ